MNKHHTPIRSSATPAPWARCLALLTLATAPALALAEDDDGIATDRPDFVESAQVVGRGVVQLETSLAFERDKRYGGDVRTWTTPTLLRVGVSDTVELRWETDGFISQRSRTATGWSTLSGFSDSSLGVKWHLTDDDGKGRPATAVLFHVDMDSGSAAFRRNGWAPSLRGAAEWELAGDASIGVMAGILWDRADTGERFRSGILAITYSRPLGENLRGFVELAGQSLAPQRFGGHVVTFDTGLSYALGKDMQVDCALSVGTNRDTPDYAFTVGLSRRFK